MIGRRALVLMLVLCAGGLAVAGSPVRLFQAVSTVPCTTMEQTLATLQSVSGSYSLAIAGRAARYKDLQAQLAQLETVDVPYSGQDLSPQPLAQPTGLQNEFKRVGHTVAAPNWNAAFTPLLVGVVSSLGAAYVYLDTPQYQSPSWSRISSLAVLGISGLGVGIYFLAQTRTAYKEVYNPAAAAANAQIRAQVQQENATIQAQNAATQKKLDERNAAIAKNEQITSERAALVNEMNAYEAKSTVLARQEIASLSAEEDRRCLERLVYQSSAIRLGPETSRIYLIVRPLNPAGNTLPNAIKSSVSFGVRSISVTDAQGVVASASTPSLFAVVPATAAPITVVYPPSFIALEFDVPMIRPVTEASAKLSIDAEIQGTQGGTQITTQVHGSISPLP